MQTAVEWLINEMPVIDWSDPYWKIKLEQAKEMEKQQIMKFAIKAVTSAVNEDANNPYNLEQLFTKTYGSKGSDDHIVDTTEMISSQTEISDEEIRKAFTIETLTQTTIYEGEIRGAIWYREQLKQR